MNIISWNVNGYNDNVHLWTGVFLKAMSPDVLFISETKKKELLLRKYFSEFERYDFIINSHDPARYHGVAMLIRKGIVYNELQTCMNISSRSDCKIKDPSTGRIISVMIENCILIGTYVPNSGGTMGKNYGYRLNEWNPGLNEWLNGCSKSLHTIWLGDINVCLDEIDVSVPAGMATYAGFTTLERTALKDFLSQGWVDIWRHRNPDKRMYSWRGNCKDITQYGMRLDNIIVSKSLLPNVMDAYMVGDCPLSDHVPIGAIIKLS